MLCFVDAVRAIAVFLIINSHSKGIYPLDIMAFGGGLGLALFFMLSGFLLTNITEQTRFFKWYWQKIIRLYVPLWIYMIVEILLKPNFSASFIEVANAFIFPTNYWFTAAMLLLYALYYWFIKALYLKYGNHAIYGGIAVLAISFIFLYTTEVSIASFSLEKLRNNSFGLESPYTIMQIIWMICLLLGVWIKKNISVEKGKRNQLWGGIVVAVVNVFVFMVAKLWGKPILLPISYIGFAISLFFAFMKNEDLFKKITRTKIGRIINIVSVCSLEIYYVQFIWIRLLRSISFPVNWICLWTITILSGFVLNRVSAKLIKKLRSTVK